MTTQPTLRRRLRWWWRRTTNRILRRPRAGTITVTLTADTTRFVEALRRANLANELLDEAAAHIRYRHRLAIEHALGLTFVRQLAVDTCHDLGLDPAVVRGVPARPEPVPRILALCEEWDRLSKGETPTTRRIREALR